MSDDLKAREAFEAWAGSVGFSLIKRATDAERYFDIDVQNAWVSWQAAWNTRPSAGPDEGLADEEIIEKIARAMAENGTDRAAWLYMRDDEKDIYRSDARLACNIVAALRPQPSAWRPIADAPKDGTRILVWSPTFNGRWVGARWDENKYAQKPNPYWRLDDERIVGLRDSRLKPPTAWQPLPSPPEN